MRVRNGRETGRTDEFDRTSYRYLTLRYATRCCFNARTRLPRTPTQRVGYAPGTRYTRPEKGRPYTDTCLLLPMARCTEPHGALLRSAISRGSGRLHTGGTGTINPFMVFLVAHATCTHAVEGMSVRQRMAAGWLWVAGNLLLDYLGSPHRHPTSRRVNDRGWMLQADARSDTPAARQHASASPTDGNMSLLALHASLLSSCVQFACRTMQYYADLVLPSRFDSAPPVGCIRFGYW